jgi:hypothetical protein
MKTPTGIIQPVTRSIFMTYLPPVARKTLNSKTNSIASSPGHATSFFLETPRSSRRWPSGQSTTGRQGPTPTSPEKLHNQACPNKNQVKVASSAIVSFQGVVDLPKNQLGLANPPLPEPAKVLCQKFAGNPKRKSYLPVAWWASFGKEVWIPKSIKTSGGSKKNFRLQLLLF